MKICFIVGSFPYVKCGIGDYTYKLSEELARQGHEVHVITSETASIQSNVIHIHNIMKDWSFKERKKIIEILKKINPYVVNIQYPTKEYNGSYMVGFLPAIIKKKIKCKVIITRHEYECPNFVRKLKYYLNFKKADKIIVAEEEFIDKIKKDFKWANIKYIPISSNIPRSKITDDRKKELLKKYNLENMQIISYFGFANKLKGIEYLLKCIPKLDNVKLLFINELNENDEYQKTLLDLIEELKIKDKVVITGFFDKEEDIADMLSISNLCVLPFINGVQTRNGSFLAAYNQEIPVITTSNKLEDENGIYYVPPKTEEELFEKIKEVLENPKEFKREILDWATVAKNYIDTFN